MITFPIEFIKINYPGYFWNTNNKKLYSIKIAGVLRPLTPCSYWNPKRYMGRPEHGTRGYTISHKNKPIFISLNYLLSLEYKDGVIDVYK